jgi:hypothetical protein
LQLGQFDLGAFVAPAPAGPEKTLLTFFTASIHKSKHAMDFLKEGSHPPPHQPIPPSSLKLLKKEIYRKEI